VISILELGEPLTQLRGVGPFVAKRLTAWLENPPEVRDIADLRRDFITMTEARKILEGGDDLLHLKGDLQMHTVWSDGAATIEELAEAGSARGYEYIAITDHSQGLKIAGGLSGEELEDQVREIDQVNASFESAGRGLRLIKSLEMNLNTEGAGDMEEAALAPLDLVLGAFHSKLRSKDDQTERYISAMRNPSINVLAHPRGRIYNFRAGLWADWEKVFVAAAENDKAVEIDAFPDRQDLDIGLLHIAKDSGVRISIGTDSHYAEQLAYIEIGVASAVAAGIPRSKILNFLSRDELLSWARG
jgi:histidinol phosphatase-like PHP family hydrolase